MPSHFVPITKTGWFYLWLAVVGLILWLKFTGTLDRLDNLNQQVWSVSESLDANQSSLVRVTDIRFNSNGLNKIQKLANKYPQALFALAGDYSGSFLKDLSSPQNISLARRTVLLSGNRSSLAAIGSDASFAGPYYPEPSKVQWQASAEMQLALQPARSASQVNLIWYKDGKLYPSFVAKVMMLFALQKPLSANPGGKTEIAKHRLITSKHHFPIGLFGEIYPIGSPAKDYSLATLYQQNTTLGKKIIFIDDLTDSQNLAKGLSSAIDNHYLISNWLSLLLEIILIVAMAMAVFRIKNIVPLYQGLILVAGFFILFLFQSLLVSQSLWLSLSLIFLITTTSWLIQLGYQREVNIFAEKNRIINRLLEQASPLFYQTQSIETVWPFLETSFPDPQLIEKIYQIAIEAEAHQNYALAKKLHHWILQNYPKYSPSLKRISELEPSSEDDDELQQTVVIDPSGEQVERVSNNILGLKNFGRYQVEGVLGKGAMGIVFQGVDPKINRHVAIKTLQLEDDLDSEKLEETKMRFFREAETAGNLSHANIVTIYDVGEEVLHSSGRSIGYIAMDLLTGAPLSEFVKPEKLLPPVLVYQLMIQMTDALEYAHRQKVIHRDIKPANIIFDDDVQKGTLTDFGIAYISDHSKTKTGTIMGSPYYMSPEQVIGLKVDGRSDIFSLGVTFYQLLSGQLPFTGESIASVAFHITKSKHESVRNWNKKLPTSAARLTNKALNKSVEKRYQTMAEFKQALINALKRDYKKSPLS